ncbi:MAG TPA: hypothetical protein ENN58_02175, partial [bacterium]|nr:hypothetical protein [bacterium]
MNKNMRKTAGLLLLCFISLFFLSAIKKNSQKTSPETSLSIIPTPFRMEHRNGTFTVNSKTRIKIDSFDKTTRDIALYLASLFKSATGLILEIDEFTTEKNTKNTISFSTSLN